MILIIWLSVPDEPDLLRKTFGFGDGVKIFTGHFYPGEELSGGYNP